MGRRPWTDWRPTGAELPLLSDLLRGPFFRFRGRVPLLLGRRKDFAENLIDFHRVLDSLIKDELQSRSIARVDTVVNPFLQVTGRPTEAMHAQFLTLVISHHGDMNLGRSHVWGDLDKGNRDIFDPRVAQFGENRHADDFSDRGGGFKRST